MIDDNRTVKVDIICPKCRAKAVFHSHLVGTYKLYPDTKGKITCANCGKNGPFEFSSSDYFYQIPIGTQILKARSLEDLMQLRDYFQKNSFLNDEPDTDFPKEFYQQRKEIVEKINKFLEKKSNK